MNNFFEKNNPVWLENFREKFANAIRGDKHCCVLLGEKHEYPSQFLLADCKDILFNEAKKPGQRIILIAEGYYGKGNLTPLELYYNQRLFPGCDQSYPGNTNSQLWDFYFQCIDNGIEVHGVESEETNFPGSTRILKAKFFGESNRYLPEETCLSLQKEFKEKAKEAKENFVPESRRSSYDAAVSKHLKTLFIEGKKEDRIIVITLCGAAHLEGIQEEASKWYDSTSILIYPTYVFEENLEIDDGSHDDTLVEKSTSIDVEKYPANHKILVDPYEYSDRFIMNRKCLFAGKRRYQAVLEKILPCEIDLLCYIEARETFVLNGDPSQKQNIDYANQIIKFLRSGEIGLNLEEINFIFSQEGDECLREICENIADLKEQLLTHRVSGESCLISC
jgi:hypothetical protein